MALERVIWSLANKYIIQKDGITYPCIHKWIFHVLPYPTIPTISPTHTYLSKSIEAEPINKQNSDINLQKVVLSVQDKQDLMNALKEMDPHAQRLPKRITIKKRIVQKHSLLEWFQNRFL